MFKCSCEKAQISQSSVKKFTNSQPSFLNRRKTSRKGPSQSLCTNEFKTVSSVYDSLWMNTGKPPQDCVLQSEHLVLDQRQGTLTPMVSWNWSISGEIDFFESSLSGHIKVWDPLDWNHLFGRMKNMNVYIYIYIHMSYTYIYIRLPEALYKENRVRFDTSFWHGRQNLPAAPRRQLSEAYQELENPRVTTATCKRPSSLAKQ